MVSERLLGPALALGLLVLNGTVQAQPSAAQRETARELMGEARRLRERGDLEGALGRFRAADAIMNVPTTALEVAATQAELGKLIDAREGLLRMLVTHPAARNPPKAGTTPSGSARAFADPGDPHVRSARQHVRPRLSGRWRGNARGRARRGGGNLRHLTQECGRIRLPEQGLPALDLARSA